MLLLTLPVIFEVDFLLKLWLKTPPENSSALVILVLVNINISSFTYFLYQGVHATGNITKQQIWMSSLYVLNVFLIYLFFKLGFNFYSALYVTIFISLCQCVLNLFMAKRYYDYKISFFIKDSFLPCLTLAIIVSGALYGVTLLMPSSIWRVLITGVVGIGLCALLGYYVVLNDDEKVKTLAFMKQIIRKRIIKYKTP